MIYEFFDLGVLRDLKTLPQSVVPEPRALFVSIEVWMEMMADPELVATIQESVPKPHTQATGRKCSLDGVQVFVDGFAAANRVTEPREIFFTDRDTAARAAVCGSRDKALDVLASAVRMVVQPELETAGVSQHH